MAEVKLIQRVDMHGVSVCVLQSGKKYAASWFDAAKTNQEIEALYGGWEAYGNELQKRSCDEGLFRFKCSKLYNSQNSALKRANELIAEIQKGKVQFANLT